MARNRTKPSRSVSDRSLETSFTRSGTFFSGYVVDPGNLALIYTVDILIDGRVVRTAYANEYVYDLAARKIGDGCFGFSVSIQTDVVDNAHVIEARISNLGTLIGAPIVPASPDRETAGIDGPGSARWLGGLRFSGWIGTDGPAAPILDVIVDGETVSQIKALGWTHVSHGAERGRAVRAFEFQLPERFADGCVHRVSIGQENGGKLLHTPMTFIAFADGLAETIGKFGDIDAERLRGELFDLLLPMSLPMSRYEDWRERFPIAPSAPVAMKGAIVLVGPGNVDMTLPTLEEQTDDDWVAVSLRAGKQQAAFDPGEAHAFLASDGAECDFVVFGMSGTLFSEDAIARIASAFATFPNADIVYGDVDILARDGGRWPLAFPAFDYERMLEQGYCAHLFAMRVATAQQLLNGGASNLYRLFNSAFDDAGPKLDRVVHLPGALGVIPTIRIAEAGGTLSKAASEHLAARGVKADVTPGAGVTLPAVRVARRPARGKTTIVIPTRNRLTLLQRCLESIRPAIDKVSADILIVDNDSSDPETLAFLDGIASSTIRVLRVEGPFNFSRLNNLAAQTCSSEYLCLLNNDIEALDDGWLEEMLGRIAEPDVGAVGALLLWPSGVIQHGGVVLGPAFSARHAFNDRVDGDPGPGDLLRVAHQCSAVSAACLLTRRTDYLEVFGMDETNFSIGFNDVDYCLKLRAMGKRVVITPHARLWHLESASRGRDDQPDRAPRYFRELETLRARWLETIMDDPFYSPILSLDPVPHSALAWPPRSREPRWPSRPRPNDTPPGL